MKDTSNFAAQMMKSQRYGHIPVTPPTPNLNHPTLQGYISNVGQVEGATFTQTLASMANRTNHLMGQAEDKTIDLVNGDPNTSIHDVMIAMGKGEVAFKLTAAISQKLISTSEKLMNMQI